jgi:vancomycin resistance protein VanJ
MVISKKLPGGYIKTVFTVIVALYITAVAVYLIMRAIFGDRFWWMSLLNTFAYLLFLPVLPLLLAAMLFKMRRNALRLVPLAMIGGLWLVPYYLPKPQAAPDGQTLNVLTFNVWGRNQRMDDVAAWILNSGADVVMLQEIVPFDDWRILPKLAELYPYRSSQDDDERWGGTPNSNVTLSRYPIVAMQMIDLNTPETANPLRIVLDVNGQHVAVYNVHLAWPARHSPRLSLPGWIDNFYLQVVLGYDDKARNQQIANLLEHLKHETLPYIVAGDFNTSDQTPTYNALAAQMHDSFREAGRGLGGSWPVSSARGLPAIVPPIIRIDYIWHSDAFQSLDARQGPPLGSDHLALQATLVLPPA